MYLLKLWLLGSTFVRDESQPEDSGDYWRGSDDGATSIETITMKRPPYLDNSESSSPFLSLYAFRLCCIVCDFQYIISKSDETFFSTNQTDMFVVLWVRYYVLLCSMAYLIFYFFQFIDCMPLYGVEAISCKKYFPPDHVFNIFFLIFTEYQLFFSGNVSKWEKIFE